MWAPCLATWLAALPALAAAPPAEGLAPAIASRRERVAEFQVIREAAQELGMRVWLFGGTAAGFAHYVRWDLAREGGDARYRESFFDYDFTNIFRSTQDADLVVDGTPEQAEQLEDLIKQKMSFLQGSKEHWEVRLLRQDRTADNGQVKQALLHNPDFLGQNTDSNSTGMIELTEPPGGEGVVRDLRDWESAEPFFLQDVTEGRLHYYGSDTHRQTSRYLAGDNPEIFSVIRYLVKAFQYDLQVDGDDLAKVQAIIDAFEPERDRAGLSSWARGWLERYGPNLIRHAVNIEQAWNTLERSGLRGKLISLSDPHKEGTLGWWLTKEPLRTGPLGEGEGKTAAELGIGIVAHETQDFLAYESITRDMTLRPNVLTSRPDHPGESAASGPGFYTRMGRKGARETGLTIRFTVDPRAREGTDFTRHGDYLRFLNRAALKVVPESLDLSMVEYLEMLRAGLADESDRGTWMKLARRLSLRPLARGDEERILAVVSEELDRVERKGGPSPLLRAWFGFPISRAHPELVDRFFAALSKMVDRPSKVLGYSDHKRIERNLFSLVRTWFEVPESRTRLELLGTLIDRYASHAFQEDGHLYHAGDSLLREIVRLPGWSDHPELIRFLMGRKMFKAAWDALSAPQWRGHPELALEVLEGLPLRREQKSDWLGWTGYKATLELAEGSLFWEHPEILRRLITMGPHFEVGVYETLTQRARTDHPELILALVEELYSPVRPRAKPSERRLHTGFQNGDAGWDGPSATGEKPVGRWLDSVIRTGGWEEQPLLRELCDGKAPHAACLKRALRRGRFGTAAAAERIAGGVAGLSPASTSNCPESATGGELSPSP